MLRKRERGAAAVEFALVLPLMLSPWSGHIDFGRLYYQQVVLSNAARDGARLASMGTTTYSTSHRSRHRVVQAARPLARRHSGRQCVHRHAGAGNRDRGASAQRSTGPSWASSLVCRPHASRERRR